MNSPEWRQKNVHAQGRTSDLDVKLAEVNLHLDSGFRIETLDNRDFEQIAIVTKVSIKAVKHPAPNINPVHRFDAAHSRPRH